MGHIVDGVWTTRNGTDWDTEASLVDGQGGSRKVSLPEDLGKISKLKWTTVRDPDGEIVFWEAKAHGLTLTIFND